MEVGGVSLDLTLIMHEKAFGDYLTGHPFLSLESEGWGTGYSYPCFTKNFITACIRIEAYDVFLLFKFCFNS